MHKYRDINKYLQTQLSDQISEGALDIILFYKFKKHLLLQTVNYFWFH